MDVPPDPLQVDPNIATAWTLPASVYIDHEIFAREKDNIFAKTWQVVGHVSQVTNPGDYFTTELVRGAIAVSSRNGRCAARVPQRLPASSRATG
jgi:hypothetical protein